MLEKFDAVQSSHMKKSSFNNGISQSSVQNFGLTPLQYTTFLPALLMITGVLMVASIDIYLPAAPFMKCYFETSEWMIQFSMMQTPIVGALVGMLYGHWSDTNGRRPALLSSLGIFAAFSFLCCFAWNIESFLALRFLQAIGAGGISIISISILADMFSGALYARYMATYSMSFPIMFAIAPVLGAHLLGWFGWQANFWFLGLIAAALWLYFIKRLPETHQDHSDTMGWGHLFKNLKALTTNSHFMRLSVCHGLPVAISAVYSVNSSFVFIDHFNFSPTAYAYIQLIPVFLNLVGSFAYRQYVVKWGIIKSIRYGLYLNVVFLILVTSGVALNFLQSPFSIVVIMCILNLSLSAVLSSCGTKAVECAPEQKGLAVAFLGLLRNGVVAGLVLVVGAFFDGTIIPVYIGMAILTAILVILIFPISKERI